MQGSTNCLECQGTTNQKWSDKKPNPALTGGGLVMVAPKKVCFVPIE